MERPRSREGQSAEPERLSPDLEVYREALERYLASKWDDQGALSEATVAILRAGGKRLRPVISLLTCEASSGDYRKGLPVASIFELAHSASLVQDDIIDESTMRHGQMATHKKYGETKAILISDVMIFDIFLELGRAGRQGLPGRKLARLAEFVGRAAKLTAEGEFYETLLSEKGTVTEDEYIRLAGLKTGSLFAAASASGALAGGGSNKQVMAAYEFGSALGISFQIRDDILDLVGKEEATGKPLMKDLQNNATNMVLIHALAHADPYQKVTIHAMLYRKWFALPEVQALLKTLDQLGSIDYANGVERAHAAKAKEALAAFPESKAKTKLEQLTEGIGSRIK